MVIRNKRRKLTRLSKITIVIILILSPIITFIIGRNTAPIKKETIVQTIDISDITSSIDYYDIPLSKKLQTHIHELCSDEEIPMSLVIAMIEQESNFNQDLVSKTNDYGLMQINQINFETIEQDYHCNDMTDPYQNVYAGIKIISKYYYKYNKDYHKALMAYNMGEYGMKKALENGILSTDYSINVIEKMNKYER